MRIFTVDIKNTVRYYFRGGSAHGREPRGNSLFYKLSKRVYNLQNNNKILNKTVNIEKR